MEKAFAPGRGYRSRLQALNAVRVKVDDYFARCRLAAFDGQALNALNRQEEEYIAIAKHDLNGAAGRSRAFL